MFSKYEGIDDTTLLSLNMLGKSMNSKPLLLNGIMIMCLIWLISDSMYGRRAYECNIYLIELLHVCDHRIYRPRHLIYEIRKLSVKLV